MIDDLPHAHTAHSIGNFLSFSSDEHAVDFIGYALDRHTQELNTRQANSLNL